MLICKVSRRKRQATFSRYRQPLKQGRVAFSTDNAVERIRDVMQAVDIEHILTSVHRSIWRE